MTLDNIGIPTVKHGYRIQWDGPAEHPIYALNLARSSHGIADAQICLNAWRSAVILNDYLGFTYFNTVPTQGLIQWPVNDAQYGGVISGTSVSIV